MERVRVRSRTLVVTFCAIVAMAAGGRGAAQTAHNDELVRRNGTKLTLRTKYRAIAYNADGKASEPSTER